MGARRVSSERCGLNGAYERVVESLAAYVPRYEGGATVGGGALNFWVSQTPDLMP